MLYLTPSSRKQGAVTTRPHRGSLALWRPRRYNVRILVITWSALMSSADTVTPEQLLAAAEQLTAEELASFAAEVVALRARRLAPSLAADEAVLLQRINATGPAAEAQRYAELIALRDAEALSGAEHAELLRLSDIREERNAERVAALVELATLRGVTLGELLRTLGLPAAADAG